ncbi:uncharacterized protein LOC142470895 isoform X2 [Ascaphus truei]|uniref:uncharacterized protein LOC142470895 isoform X2 n=1 Tax=Ascaphus truei TaxID=8439 RepID=UPI003F5AC6D8
MYTHATLLLLAALIRCAGTSGTSPLGVTEGAAVSTANDKHAGGSNYNISIWVYNTDGGSAFVSPDCRECKACLINNIPTFTSGDSFPWEFLFNLLVTKCLSDCTECITIKPLSNIFSTSLTTKAPNTSPNRSSQFLSQLTGKTQKPTGGVSTLLPTGSDCTKCKACVKRKLEEMIKGFVGGGRLTVKDVVKQLLKDCASDCIFCSIDIIMEFIKQLLDIFNTTLATKAPNTSPNRSSQFLTQLTGKTQKPAGGVPTLLTTGSNCTKCKACVKRKLEEMIKGFVGGGRIPVEDWVKQLLKDCASDCIFCSIDIIMEFIKQLLDIFNTTLATTAPNTSPNRSSQFLTQLTGKTQKLSDIFSTSLATKAPNTSPNRSSQFPTRLTGKTQKPADTPYTTLTTKKSPNTSPNRSSQFLTQQTGQTKKQTDGGSTLLSTVDHCLKCTACLKQRLEELLKGFLDGGPIPWADVAKRLLILCSTDCIFCQMDIKELIQKLIEKYL